MARPLLWRRDMRGLVRVALIASLSGCSFIAAHPPPSIPEAGTPRCNPGKGAVAVDGVVAGIAGVIALASASSSSGAALGSGLVGATYFGSALYGNWSANQCRKALAEADQRIEAPPPPVVADDAEVKEVAKAEVVATPPAPTSQPPSLPASQPSSPPSDPWSDFWTEAP